MIWKITLSIWEFYSFSLIVKVIAGQSFSDTSISPAYLISDLLEWNFEIISREKNK